MLLMRKVSARGVSLDGSEERKVEGTLLVKIARQNYYLNLKKESVLPVDNA